MSPVTKPKRNDTIVEWFTLAGQKSEALDAVQKALDNGYTVKTRLGRLNGVLYIVVESWK